ncbi:MAG TPA: imidazole glycerol phosphate synthase subunit HisF [Sedimentibacter sp.]|nr:imidazole glycerol phosphate synthase subunit HisF [Sedimentibacter sp.]HNZ82699.1 imidazole glycerol phosphate synthase subunit HisF [Sedimentibacter sp.]HOH69853.1 imidazole glycerol phosphate synthase subunit HisF [Sedimentibacter sp.]
MAVRIIPCLDVINGRVVKGTKFKDIKDVDDPVNLGKYYSDSGADELVFYDITASLEGRKTSLEFVKKVAAEINIPFCVGGGISSIEDFKHVLESGADKISINSAAVKNPYLIKEASGIYGSKCLVLALDVKRNEEGSWSVYVKGGKEKTSLDAVEWVKTGVKLGAGEIVVNSIDEDGMKTGYDLELLKRVKAAVNVPVIASGGAGKYEHFLEAVKYAAVDGVLAASVFHFGEIKIPELKKYLRENGL